MKIKRFFAKEMRQGIRQVREALGADAVILSNTRVNGGVEIVAAVDYDESLLQAETVGQDVLSHPGNAKAKENTATKIDQQQTCVKQALSLEEDRTSGQFFAEFAPGDQAAGKGDPANKDGEEDCQQEKAGQSRL